MDFRNRLITIRLTPSEYFLLSERIAGLNVSMSSFVRDLLTKEIGSSPGPSHKTIAKNAPCPCGSGKKYKKCCMNKENK